MRKFKRRELTQSQQLLWMQSRYPELRARVQRQRSIVWEGPWTPDDLGGRYLIRVSYKQGFRPRIAIVEPPLRLAPGHDKLPHTYGGQTDICVHRPEEWHKGLLIADTIMPWISQWLYFYEIWAVTGKWIGKGTHPNLPQHSAKGFSGKVPPHESAAAGNAQRVEQNAPLAPWKQPQLPSAAESCLLTPLPAADPPSA